MTPDELRAIRKRDDDLEAYGYDPAHPPQSGEAYRRCYFAEVDRGALLDYIDVLHEDLALTRQERDHAKHQALEHRKARARLEYDLLARDEKDTE